MPSPNILSICSYIQPYHNTTIQKVIKTKYLDRQYSCTKCRISTDVMQNLTHLSIINNMRRCVWLSSSEFIIWTIHVFLFRKAEIASKQATPLTATYSLSVKEMKALITTINTTKTQRKQWRHITFFPFFFLCAGLWGFSLGSSLILLMWCSERDRWSYIFQHPKPTCGFKTQKPKFLLPDVSQTSTACKLTARES